MVKSAEPARNAALVTPSTWAVRMGHAWELGLAMLAWWRL